MSSSSTSEGLLAPRLTPLSGPNRTSLTIEGNDEACPQRAYRSYSRSLKKEVVSQKECGGSCSDDGGGGLELPLPQRLNEPGCMLGSDDLPWTWARGKVVHAAKREKVDDAREKWKR